MLAYGWLLDLRWECSYPFAPQGAVTCSKEGR